VPIARNRVVADQPLELVILGNGLPRFPDEGLRTAEERILRHLGGAIESPHFAGIVDGIKCASREIRAQFSEIARGGEYLSQAGGFLGGPNAIGSGLFFQLLHFGFSSPSASFSSRLSLPSCF